MATNMARDPTRARRALLLREKDLRLAKRSFSMRAITWDERKKKARGLSWAFGNKSWRALRRSKHFPGGKCTNDRKRFECGSGFPRRDWRVAALCGLVKTANAHSTCLRPRGHPRVCSKARMSFATSFRMSCVPFQFPNSRWGPTRSAVFVLPCRLLFYARRPREGTSAHIYVAFLWMRAIYAK